MCSFKTEYATSDFAETKPISERTPARKKNAICGRADARPIRRPMCPEMTRYVRKCQGSQTSNNAKQTHRRIPARTHPGEPGCPQPGFPPRNDENKPNGTL